MVIVAAGATLFLIGLNWVSVWYGWRASNYASKALVIVAMLAWLLLSAGTGGVSLWFAAGLFFSLIGDVLLLLSARYFLFGVSAFLLTHICYLIGFFISPPQLNPAALFLALFCLSIWVFVYAMIRRWVSSNAAYYRMLRPLAAYSLAICGMVGAALLTLTRADWRPEAAGLATSGALLFLFSDLLLAYDRFALPVPAARLWKRVTYHLGQLAIIAGVMLQMGR